MIGVLGTLGVLGILEPPMIPKPPYLFLAFGCGLYKVIQEGCNAFQSRFALTFYLYLELNTRLADTS